MMLLLLALVAARAEPERVWVADLELHGEAAPIWFAEERAVVTDAVGAVLRGLGVEVPDDAHARRVWQEARLDVGCLAPAPVEVAARRVYRTPPVRPVAVCRDGGCVLTVELPGEARWTRGIRVPSEGSPGDWSQRLLDAGLTPVAAVPLLADAVAARPERPGVFLVRRSDGWTDELTLPAEPFAACFDAGPPREPAPDLHVEVDAEGRVTRCEPALDDRLLAPANVCACHALRGLDLGAGAEGRRAVLRVRPRPSAAVGRVALAVAETTDPTVMAGEVDLAPLAACADGPARVPVVLEVGPDGRVTGADLRALQRNDRGAYRCVRAALPDLRFDCPRSGTARIAADLVFAG